jgi:hypothetical protein
MVNLEKSQLRQMLSSAAELGATNALIAAGVEKTQINQADAYRRFSRKSVDKWIRNGDVLPVKTGRTVKLNVMELESMAQTNQLVNKHLNRAV